jgi:threonine/homoserine/homoserine lactone efflux protein
MDLGLSAVGVAIGLAVAAPLGPVNVLVIRAAMRRGPLAGLISGAGSTMADMVFAVVAAFGIRSVERFILDYALPLQLAGGLLLVVIGIRTAKHHVTQADLAAGLEPATPRQLWRKALTTFSITITNPAALAGTLAIFGTMSGVLRLGASPDRPPAVLLGFLLGSLAWWLFLVLAARGLHGRLTAPAIDRITRWTGVLIAAFGFALLMELLY